jgi:hypothetical protein
MMPDELDVLMQRHIDLQDEHIALQRDYIALLGGIGDRLRQFNRYPASLDWQVRAELAEAALKHIMGLLTSDSAAGAKERNE